MKTEILSSITQQILSIFLALAADLKNLIIENMNIRLVPTCGIFITTCPTNEDNSNLPDNFKSMFRTVSMIVPDSKIITESLLFVEGFKETKSLADKILNLFSLCKQLLNKETHYEYKLRDLIELIKYAGKCKRKQIEVPEEEVYFNIFLYFYMDPLT